MVIERVDTKFVVNETNLKDECDSAFNSLLSSLPNEGLQTSLINVRNELAYKLWLKNGSQYWQNQDVNKIKAQELLINAYKNHEEAAIKKVEELWKQK